MIPVYRNETQAIDGVRQLGKSFFVRDKFYTCISELGNG